MLQDEPRPFGKKISVQNGPWACGLPEEMVHRLRGFLDGHQSGLDRIVDGPALEPPGQRDGRRLVVG
jgi:hypothetical protein